MNKTHQLYESKQRDDNEERYGDGSDQCICCLKPMKPSENSLWVHMNTDWEAVRNDIHERNCLEETGAESQGAFRIGNSCAKKMPKEFIIHKDMDTTKGKIITTYEFPPIPIRQYDWAAIREDYEPGDLIGTGRTKQDAIDNLIEQEQEDEL